MRPSDPNEPNPTYTTFLCVADRGIDANVEVDADVDVDVDVDVGVAVDVDVGDSRFRNSSKLEICSRSAVLPSVKSEGQNQKPHTCTEGGQYPGAGTTLGLNP